jgi:hypothetical protein
VQTAPEPAKEQNQVETTDAKKISTKLQPKNSTKVLKKGTLGVECIEHNN